MADNELIVPQIPGQRMVLNELVLHLLPQPLSFALIALRRLRMRRHFPMQHIRILAIPISTSHPLLKTITHKSFTTKHNITQTLISNKT